MKKLTILLILPLFLFGCATVNFSSKYYTLPVNYEKDINEVWDEILLKTPLKYKNLYSYKIVKDKKTKYTGIPQNNNGVISLPEYFIKYVWEFYYPQYHKDILICLFLHEIAHTESGYPATPPEQHFLCDRYAIEQLSTIPAQFYSSLIVIRDYWSARKGAGGHLFNISYNTLVATFNILSGNVGGFTDWFATDLDDRISLLKSTYPSVYFCFKRNK